MRASGELELREPRLEVVPACLELFEVATHGNQRLVAGGEVALNGNPSLRESDRPAKWSALVRSMA